MQQIPSWEAPDGSPSQEIARFCMEPTGILPCPLVQAMFWLTGSVPGKGRRFYSIDQPTQPPVQAVLGA
jgi:hypothetical protein